MYAEIGRFDKSCQPASVDEDVYILNPIDMLPDDYDDQRAEEEDLEAKCFWRHPRHFNVYERDIVQSYLAGVEDGFIPAADAVNDLIGFGLFPHELMLDMYAVFLRALEAGETA